MDENDHSDNLMKTEMVKAVKLRWGRPLAILLYQLYSPLLIKKMEERII